MLRFIKKDGSVVMTENTETGKIDFTDKEFLEKVVDENKLEEVKDDKQTK